MMRYQAALRPDRRRAYRQAFAGVQARFVTSDESAPLQSWSGRPPGQGTSSPRHRPR
ncbi:hypothetical protein NOVOSPHI9U_40095 [Novosphingobium sp. 9U]|nr:hypothetical protein NOVOSPHI9U_40095 [Novosphingobium sp. 9U]